MQRTTSKAPARSASPSATLSLRIQPRASKNEITRQDDGSYKVRLTAPPVDNAANDALIAFLSDRIGVAKKQVEIVTGHTARQKIVRITGMSLDEVRQLLPG